MQCRRCLAKALVDFIAGRQVTCRQVDYDHKNNRPVAVCAPVSKAMGLAGTAAPGWCAKAGLLFGEACLHQMLAEQPALGGVLESMAFRERPGAELGIDA